MLRAWGRRAVTGALAAEVSKVRVVGMSSSAWAVEELEWTEMGDILVDGVWCSEWARTWVG